MNIVRAARQQIRPVCTAHVDELLMLVWERQVCRRGRQQYGRHRSLLPAPPLDTQPRPVLRRGGFWERGRGGAEIQFVPATVCLSQQGMELFFFIFYFLRMLPTQTRVIAKPLLSTSLKEAPVHQDWAGL